MIYKTKKKVQEPVLNAENMPEHIAFIMDGNGRWAQRRGLPRTVGYDQGAKTFRKIVEYCIEINIKYATFFAFSTENWKRPGDEVAAIMRMFDKYLDELIADLVKCDAEVKFIGDMSKFEETVMYAKMRDVQSKTVGRRMKLNIALNYGGRDEIINAADRAFKRNGALTAESLERELYTHGQKDPDLVIRTSGEQRFSNFLLWQCAYSELWFTDVLWPDFNEKVLNEAMLDYSKRKRRYGGV